MSTVYVPLIAKRLHWAWPTYLRTFQEDFELCLPMLLTKCIYWHSKKISFVNIFLKLFKCFLFFQKFCFHLVIFLEDNGMSPHNVIEKWKSNKCIGHDLHFWEHSKGNFAFFVPMLLTRCIYWHNKKISFVNIFLKLFECFLFFQKLCFHLVIFLEDNGMSPRNVIKKWKLKRV